MKRWWITGLALLGLAGGVLVVRAYANARTQAGLANLQTAPISIGSLTAVVGATGTVRAEQSARLTFQTNGWVEQVLVQVGERVEAGQVMITLAQASLSPSVILAEADRVAAQRALDELLESDVARSQAELALAQARDALHDARYDRIVMQRGNRASRDTIDAARARVALAQDRVSRAQDRYQRTAGDDDDPAKAAALGDLAAARLELRAAQRALDWYLGEPGELDQALLDAAVALAEARLAQAEREWERLRDGPDPDDVAAARARLAAAEATLNLGRVLAPFAGTVTSLHAVAGDPVTPGTPAVGLADLADLLVDVEVSEVDINRVRLGQPVTLTFDAVPGRSYRGRVADLGLSGVSVQGVVSFPVTVEVLDADDQVRPGMTAAVNIVVEELEQVLLVPNRAVRLRNGQRVVYVLRTGQLETVPIVLGASSDSDSQVLEGDLAEGDRVVLNPPLEFEAGGPPSFMRR